MTWTAERRERQAQAIKRWQPWTRSTGPRSDAGKAKAARNSYKGGQRVQLRTIARELREMARLMKATW